MERYKLAAVFPQPLWPDVTLVELTTTLVEMKTECPFPEKILFAAETATSRQNRKVKGDYCVYELELTKPYAPHFWDCVSFLMGAFKNIIDKEERDTLINKGIISDEILNEAMSTIDEVVKKKLKPETLRKARFLDTKSNALQSSAPRPAPPPPMPRWGHRCQRLSRKRGS